MMAPFFKYGLFGTDTSLVMAFVIGIGFGFALERAGFGGARKLVSQFYLDDLAVFKVMFTAIVTAMLGVTYLSWIGLLDLSQVYLVPTNLAPQVVGGLLLGFGFVIGGYCPGTSVVATATGKIDSVLFLFGVIGGTVAFAEGFPLVRTLYDATAFGPTTIPQYFNLPYGLVVLGVVLMAVGGFAGATWVERKMAARQHAASGDELAAANATRSRDARTNRRLAALAVGLGVLAIFASPMPGSIARVNTHDLALGVQRGAGRLQARELSDWMIKGTDDYRVIDLRDERAFAEYHIPGAENIAVAALGSAGLARTETIVLCSTDGSEAAQAWVLLRAAGFSGVRVLNGGLDAWKRDVLGQAATGTASAANASSRPIPVPKVEPPVVPAGGAKPAATKKKKEGC